MTFSGASMGAALDKIEQQWDEISPHKTDSAVSPNNVEVGDQSKEETITESYPFLDDTYWETADAEHKARMEKMQKKRTLTDMLTSPLPGDIVVSKEDNKKFPMKAWLLQPFSASDSSAKHYTSLNEDGAKTDE